MTFFKYNIIKDIETSGKFYYENLKCHFEIEHYLEFVKRPEYKKAITQFRLGIHNLRINTGRYENQGAPIPVEERICRSCNNNQLENITHFIMECEKYSTLRELFIPNITEKYPNFITLSPKEKKTLLLNEKSPHLCNIIGKYLHDIYMQRK